MNIVSNMRLIYYFGISILSTPILIFSNIEFYWHLDTYDHQFIVFCKDIKSSSFHFYIEISVLRLLKIIAK